MGFYQAVATGVFLKYSVFSGRASRSEFWYSVLFIAIVYLVFGALALAIREPFYITLLACAIVVSVLPTLALTNRRLHDVSRTGWWQAPQLIAPTITLAMAGYVFFALSLNLESWFSLVIKNLGNFSIMRSVFILLWSAAAIFKIIVFVFCLFRSHGDNQYGPAPLTSAAANTTASAATSATDHSAHSNVSSSSGINDERPSNNGTDNSAHSNTSSER